MTIKIPVHQIMRMYQIKRKYQREIVRHLFQRFKGKGMKAYESVGEIKKKGAQTHEFCHNR